MTATASAAGVITALTRSKISRALVGRKDSDATRALKSSVNKGSNHRLYGQPLPIAMLDRAAELKGTKVYVYDQANFELVNGVEETSPRKTIPKYPTSSERPAH